MTGYVYPVAVCISFLLIRWIYFVSSELSSHGDMARQSLLVYPLLTSCCCCLYVCCPYFKYCIPLSRRQYLCARHIHTIPVNSRHHLIHTKIFFCFCVYVVVVYTYKVETFCGSLKFSPTRGNWRCGWVKMWECPSMLHICVYAGNVYT